MKIKIKNFINSKQAMDRLAEIKNCSGATTYKIAKFLKKFIEEYSLIEKLKIDIFRKFGSEKDGKINVDPDKMVDFYKDLNEFIESEIDFDCDTLGLSLIDGLSASDMLILEENNFIKFIE